MALRGDKVPGELADAALMRWMGWGWRDLCEAPWELVEDIRTWMAKEGGIARERAAVEKGRGRG